MKRETSRYLLLAEGAVLVVPLTVVLATLVFTTLEYRCREFTELRCSDVLLLLASVATVGGWVLLVRCLRGGAEALRATWLGWWLAAGLGCAMVLVAFASALLPESRPYSRLWSLRQELEAGALGLPLVVVVVHLALEAGFRRPRPPEPPAQVA